MIVQRLTGTTAIPRRVLGHPVLTTLIDLTTETWIVLAENVRFIGIAVASIVAIAIIAIASITITLMTALILTALNLTALILTALILTALIWPICEPCARGSWLQPVRRAEPPLLCMWRALRLPLRPWRSKRRALLVLMPTDSVGVINF